MSVSDPTSINYKSNNYATKTIHNVIQLEKHEKEKISKIDRLELEIFLSYFNNKEFF